MPHLARIAFYSDLTCPFAYLTRFRLRQLRAEYRDWLVIDYRCLALEYVNREATPKPVIEAEAPLVLLDEPEIPYRPWSRPDSEWPVTVWPAFEAVACAARQGPDYAEELDWAIRRAFFAESRCIALRHVLLDLAAQSGLAMDRFADDFDHGLEKKRVVEESRDGWERLRVNGSPTLVLPDGRQNSPPGLPAIELDLKQGGRLTAYQPAACRGKECRAQLKQLLEQARPTAFS